MTAKTRKTAPLTLQGMETRAVPASLANGVLAIPGTAGADVCEVRRVTVDGIDRIEVTLNGTAQQFRAGRVHLIRFNGKEGNDTFTAEVRKDVVALGGDGADRLTTAGGNDKFDGGKGRDVLVGGAGNDRLLGGLADDWLSGGEGNDRLYGGRGDDVLTGRSGNDRLRAGDGLDVVFGGIGNDQFWGAANDQGPLSAPVITPDGTAEFYGVQDANIHPGDRDRVWS